MNVVRRRRIFFALLVVVCSALAFYLVILALRQNINFFFTPTQIMQGQVKQPVRFRIGGKVQIGSLARGVGLQVRFSITDPHYSVPVQYTGMLPDLFKEGQWVVVLGSLNEQRVFIADEVLAKHDENYMPPSS